MDNEDRRPRPPQSEELTYHGAPRCTAKSTQSGERCKKARIPGTNVCGTHGGRAPQVQRKARLRLLELVDPAVGTLARIMVDGNAKHTDRLRAAENVLDRAGVPRKVDMPDSETAKALLLERLLAMREDNNNESRSEK